jgi:hypothetical protein
LQVSAAGRVLVDQLVAVLGRILDDVIVVAVIDDVHFMSFSASPV